MYALVFAALLLLGGAIGDRYGRRRALLAGLAIFGAGSAAAMTVSDPGWLIVMRGVLGIGAALVMPATLSTITSTFPPAERAKAVGAWAGVAGASAILGLLASGLLLEVWSWRAVFGLNVALARRRDRRDPAGHPGVRRPVRTQARPGRRPDHRRRPGHARLLDHRGADGRLGRRVTLVGLALGLALLGAFLVWELRHPTPLLDPRLFRHRAFAAGTLSITLQFFAFFGFVFLVLQYLQLVRGYSPLVSAVSLVPMAMAMMPSARVIAPKMAAHVGALRVCLVGLLLITSGLVVLSQLGTDSSYWLLLAGLLPLGAGMGLAMTPATTAITDALPTAKQGVGSAVNDLARELGGALGIAVLGSLLQSTYRGNLGLDGVPEPLAEQARSSIVLAGRLGPAVAHDAQAAFTDGLQVALLCAAGAVALAAVGIAALLHGDGDKDRQPSDDDQPVELASVSGG